MLATKFISLSPLPEMFTTIVSPCFIEGATFLTGLKEKNIYGDGRELNLTINTSSNNTIYSFGVIEPYVFNRDIDATKYLLICRKDSLGYVEFIRGKYPLYNKDYIQNIINEMTIQEKTSLLTKNFDILWKNLWGDFYGSQYRCEEKSSRDKFEQIKEGIHLFDDTFFSLETLIKNSTTNTV